MQLSIVTSTFNSAQTIEEFIKKIYASINVLNITDYEIIIVDDGSSDNTLIKLKEIKKTKINIKILELSRNFGHHKALMTGIKKSIGNFTFLIDSDLEEDPENLILFYNKIINSENDLIYGIQKKRSSGFISNFFGSAFYKIFNCLSELKIPENVMTVTLFNSSVKEEIIKHNEVDLFLHGIIHTIGFTKYFFLINKKFKGKTHYSFSKKIELCIEAIISFSSAPLKLFFYLGFITSFCSLVFMFYLIGIKLIKINIILPGYTSLMLTIIFFGGLILSGIGILGSYLSKIYTEVKKRPQTIVKKIY